MAIASGKVRETDPRLPALRQGCRFSGSTFEAWLSRIAEDQPYLSPSENLANRKLFIDLAGAIYEVLGEHERQAAKNLPEWLFDLLSVWHARKATVITFNYDTLIEGAVTQHLGAAGSVFPAVTPGDVLGGFPALPPQITPPAGSGTPTFQLLKLHGSLLWYWVPGDTTGMTVQRWEPPVLPEHRQ